MITPPVQYAVEDRMYHEAARIGLVGCRHDRPDLAEAFCKLGEFRRFAERIVISLRAGQRFGRAGEIPRREERRQ